MAPAFGLGKAAQAAATTSSVIDESTPWVAAADGDLHLLQTSLQTLGLPLTAADENGYTLLQAAASYSHGTILQWLVDNIPSNIDKSQWINATDNEGDTALHYAGSRSAAEFLVHHGINVELKNIEGKTALESKQAELEDAMQEDEEEDMVDDDDDDDDDGEDEERVHLKDVIAYLSSLPSLSQ